MLGRFGIPEPTRGGLQSLLRPAALNLGAIRKFLWVAGNQGSISGGAAGRSGIDAESQAHIYM